MEPTNRVFLSAVGDKVRIRKSIDPVIHSDDEMNISIASDDSNRLIIRDKNFEQFNASFDKFTKELRQLLTVDKQLNRVCVLLKELMTSSELLYTNLVKSSRSPDCVKLISKTTNYINEKLNEFGSKFKRNKQISKSASFVPVEEISLGLKWKTKIKCDEPIPDHTLHQTSFQYVSIIKTLQTLFLNEDFQRVYFQYNNVDKHSCTEGEYKDYCCGRNFKTFEIFNRRDTIQLQLSTDDFEVCSALKTKANIHKICAVYLQIRNMPEEYKSKLKNIYLVALCHTQNFKSNDLHCNFDVIARTITDELLTLENNGLHLQNGQQLNCGLIHIACDNLAANSIFGFSEGFNSSYYCRICECSQTECRSQLIPDPSKIRQQANYNQYLDIIRNSEKLDLKESKGIRKYCIFNDLKYFSIFKNFSVDVMHDLHEGIIPFFVKFFFNFALEKKILSVANIQQLVRDFNYGHLNIKNKPSLINIKKHNLCQNASQMYCLFTRLPFIFIEHRTKLQEVWTALEYLLQMSQVILSKEISEQHVKRLEYLIENHYKFLVEKFKLKLIPKHHFVMHYPQIIRLMGPVILMWTMRIEGKHKTFTTASRKKQNFINITKTLAQYHQEVNSFEVEMLKNQIKESKNIQKLIFSDVYFHNELLFKDMPNEISNYYLKTYFAINSLEYRQGLIIIEDDVPYEIMFLISDEKTYFVCCNQCSIIRFNKNCNSIEIIQTETKVLYNIEHLKNKETYDKIFSEGNVHIAANNLKVFNQFEMIAC